MTETKNLNGAVNLLKSLELRGMNLDTWIDTMAAPGDKVTTIKKQEWELAGANSEHL